MLEEDFHEIFLVFLHMPKIISVLAKLTPCAHRMLRCTWFFFIFSNIRKIGKVIGMYFSIFYLLTKSFYEESTFFGSYVKTTKILMLEENFHEIFFFCFYLCHKKCWLKLTMRHRISRYTWFFWYLRILEKSAKFLTCTSRYSICLKNCLTQNWHFS